MRPDNDSSTGTRIGGCSETVTYSRERGERPSESVIRAVSAATGKDPMSMRPLSRVIDPDALDQLFTPRERVGPDAPESCVTFQYVGCTVIVWADGRIVVSLSEFE